MLLMLLLLLLLLLLLPFFLWHYNTMVQTTTVEICHGSRYPITI
jgi:hypothetical protein